MRITIDLTVLLIFGIVAMLFVAYEIAGLTIPGWHTISWFAHKSLLLRYSIAALFPAAMIWFLWHTARYIPR